jgi:uncharacterized protein YjiS (DUF1127 family)
MTTRIQCDFPAAPGLGYRPVSGGWRYRGWLAWVHAAVARWRERRILEVLDERMLRDIGISRSQALAEAAKPCWRR